MKKLRLGTIGTSWITDSFITAALNTGSYELAEVYSRTAEKGRKFSKKYGKISVEDDFDRFINNEKLDVIYIASPNSLHFDQSMQALKAKKHVIVEKPAVTSPKEWDALVEEAKNNNVFIFEAAKHMHTPNFKEVKKIVQDLGAIKGATFAFSKYSSKFDAYLAGEEPNIFSLKFAGGALMDLGIYPVYLSLALFGKPENSYYFARKLSTGVDGNGTIILRYPSFDVTIFVGKNTTSEIGGEIYGEQATLLLDHVSEVSQAELLDYHTNQKTKLPLNEQKSNEMYYEAETFAHFLNNPQNTEVIEEYRKYSALAKDVATVLYDLRHQEEIYFTNENQ